MIELNDVSRIKALNILKTYNGLNPYILDIKKSREEKSFLPITENQSKYIIQNYNFEAKEVNKFLDLTNYFKKSLMSQFNITVDINKILIEKIIAEQEKSYHAQVKLLKNRPSELIWIPKNQLNEDLFQVIPEVNVEWNKYSARLPMKHQEEAIIKLLQHDKYLLLDTPGLGKTATSIIAAIESNVSKILIICPASLKLNWKKEISIYDDPEKISIIQREWLPNKWTIINYDILDKFNTIDKPKKGKKSKFKYQEFDETIVNNQIIDEKFDLIIFDEAHYLKTLKSNRTKHAKKIIKTIKKRWLLTGTPITNKPVDLFSLLDMVEHPLSNNYNSFLYSYCNAKTLRINGRRIIKADGASNLEELNRRIQPISIRRRKEDVLELPDKIISPIYLSLDDDDLLDYELSVERYILMREEQGVNLTFARKLVELSVLRRWVAEKKIKHTKELIDNSLESDKKVIVFTDYTSVVNMLRDNYDGICTVINGETSQSNRQKAVDDFQNNPNIKLFIGNTVAAGVGLTLTSAEVVIVNDLNFTPANIDQSLDRAYRIGQTKDVICYFPLFDNTVDTIVYDILEKKRAIINMAIDGVIDNKGVIEEILDKIDEKYKQK
jgi:SWI/SNF-related matrix-associated actin-dependent regulator of chromatin subfamily A-like protein 1